MSDFTFSPLGILLVIVLLLPTIAAVLMPLYVIVMADRVKKMQKMMEKMLWQAERQTEELRKVRERGEA